MKRQTTPPSRVSVLMRAFVLIVLAPWIPRGAATVPRPNIVVILADDLGFSDLGCYGSEIHTPTLDRLAARGLRFSNFYNTAKCHSSRVSLLSGRWCRQAGDEPMNRAVTIPEILAPAGYFTMMTGKWHLAKEPTDFGFQRYFGHLSGSTNPVSRGNDAPSRHALSSQNHADLNNFIPAGKSPNLSCKEKSADHPSVGSETHSEWISNRHENSDPHQTLHSRDSDACLPPRKRGTWQTGHELRR